MARFIFKTLSGGNGSNIVPEFPTPTPSITNTPTYTPTPTVTPTNTPTQTVTHTVTPTNKK